MSERKQDLLNIIVEEYIKTALPVGSGLIVEKYLHDISSATVRNDMSELEQMGLIFQPHTSAGRVPTQAGYKQYLENINARNCCQAPAKDRKIISDAVIGESEADIKNLAKALAGISESAVLIGFSPMNVYYTGISNIFRQPEFREQSQVFSISEIIDHLDEVMNSIFHKVGDDLQIFIGEGNPFGNLTSVITVKCGESGGTLIGLLGPNRMDYRANIGLLKCVREQFKQIS